MTALKIQDDIMFIRLTRTLPKQSRKIKAQAQGVNDKRLRATARLYSGKAFQTIKSYDAYVRTMLLSKAIEVPSCFTGSYILPVAMTTDVLTLLEDAKNTRDSLVDEFLRYDYPNERELARTELGLSFVESDFPDPDTLRQSFTMSWSIFTLNVPDNIPDEVRQAEETKLKQQFESVFSECRQALRQTLSDLVGHLAEQLKPTEDGKKRKLYASSVEKLQDFLDTINSRDVTSDTALRELSAKAKAVIGDVTADDLKKRDSLFMQKMQDDLTTIKTELGKVIETEKTRKIDLDLE